MNVQTTKDTTIDLSQLVTALTTRRSSIAKLDEDKLAVVARGFEAFATLDVQVTGIQRAMGEMAYKFLALPIEEQKPVVVALAAAMGLPEPNYDGWTTGRIQLAHVIYGKHPEKVKVRRGHKDSLAGKSLSKCLRIYKESAGLLNGHSKKRDDGTAPLRAMRIAYVWLEWITKTEAENELLNALYERLGFDSETLEKWLEHEEGSTGGRKGKKAA